jgi:hypothetical protein
MMTAWISKERMPLIDTAKKYLVLLLKYQLNKETLGQLTLNQLSQFSQLLFNPLNPLNQLNR